MIGICLRLQRPTLKYNGIQIAPLLNVFFFGVFFVLASHARIIKKSRMACRCHARLVHHAVTSKLCALFPVSGAGNNTQVGAMIRPAFTHWFDVVDLTFVSNTQSTQLARFVAFRPIGDLLWSAMEIPILFFVIAFCGWLCHRVQPAARGCHLGQV
jgi:hypothetical protein